MFDYTVWRNYPDTSPAERYIPEEGDTSEHILLRLAKSGDEPIFDFIIIQHLEDKFNVTVGTVDFEYDMTEEIISDLDYFVGEPPVDMGKNFCNFTRVGDFLSHFNADMVGGDKLCFATKDEVNDYLKSQGVEFADEQPKHNKNDYER